MKMFKKKAGGSKESRPSSGGKSSRPSSGGKSSASSQKLEVELKETKETLNEAREILKDQSKARKNAERERDEAISQLEEVKKQVAQLKEEKIGFETKIAALSDESGKLNASLKEKDDELKKNKDYIYEQMERWQKTEEKTEGNVDKKLELKVKSLERQLVEMTGQAIMSGELDDLKRENTSLKTQISDYEAKINDMRMETGRAKEESSTSLQLLEDTISKESARRKELEDQLKEREDEAGQLSLELGKHKTENVRLERELRDQREKFEQLEKQRVASLDGKTAALLLVEREKVEKEISEKFEEEKKQLIQDQRQAMEAIVSAVRAEEQMISAGQKSPASLPTASPSMLTKLPSPLSFFSKRKPSEESTTEAPSSPARETPKVSLPPSSPVKEDLVLAEDDDPSLKSLSL